jgi:beta-phosphoglucomutase-like phosphatase (HAD superfamily)
VEAIRTVLFEPVGCLAEFRPDEFNAAATELGAAAAETAPTGSQAYWRLTGLIEQQPERFAAARARLQDFELAAVEHADLYPDVAPCLAELRELGIATVLVSSLSRAAIDRFIARFSLSDLFAGAVAREEAGGVRARVLCHAVERIPLDPQHIMVLVDTAEGLDLAKQLKLSAMLMINDYDEGRALSALNPAGGIVSLAELPDALRVIAQQSGLRQPSRPPRGPFELFDPT